ncbi:hypothetical protein CLAIMM_00395 [Cladophialophora immunda]|nr:hypothetical protein CLAIMM_00395 [Cladophialophora immunda]
MSKFTYTDGVAVWKLVYYTPALFSSLFVAFRHGFTKGSGWIYLTIFCTVRIVGSAAQLVLISKPTSHGASTTALICSVLGLSPLLLASLGLMARTYYGLLRQPYNTIFSLIVLKLVQIPAAVGLILCIVGATNAKSPSSIDDDTSVKVGVILFTTVFALLCILCLGASVVAQKMERGEGRTLMIAVALALPFILVRLIYALVATFGHNVDFTPGNGSAQAVTISLFMEVLEEMIVVLLYVATGLRLPAVPTHMVGQGDVLAYRFGRGDFNGGKLGLLSLAAAVLFSVDAKAGKRPENRHGTARNSRGAVPMASQAPPGRV